MYGSLVFFPFENFAYVEVMFNILFLKTTKFSFAGTSLNSF